MQQPTPQLFQTCWGYVLVMVLFRCRQDTKIVTFALMPSHSSVIFICKIMQHTHEKKCPMNEDSLYEKQQSAIQHFLLYMLYLLV